jgi:DNA-binding IclR family transcriptional regulator
MNPPLFNRKSSQLLISVIAKELDISKGSVLRVLTNITNEGTVTLCDGRQFKLKLKLK